MSLISLPKLNTSTQNKVIIVIIIINVLVTSASLLSSSSSLLPLFIIIMGWHKSIVTRLISYYILGVAKSCKELYDVYK